MFHAGSLAYRRSRRRVKQAIYSAVPTIVDVYLDRRL